MTINLILAFFWLILSIGLFLYPFFNQGARLNIGDTGISFAWLALFFFCYNLLRWWMFRIQKRDREVMEGISGRKRKQEEERNPDFDFNDNAP